MPKATAFAPSLIAVLLGCSALIGPAQAGWFDSDSKSPAPVVKKDDKPQALPAVTLDDSIREAQKLRLAGNYQDAVNHLSQLMLVAADDPRIISEYGKTLVSMGRADEAEKFLTRAQQLQPDDWTVYSAMGVADDEMGNQKAAQINYERALSLKPGEPSVLNNYALSRMLAKDPAMARKLADRAETGNSSAKDEKIERNIALIRSMAPESHEGVAVNTPAPGTIVPPVTAPVVPAAVATAALPPVNPAQPVSPVAKPIAAAQPVNKLSQPTNQAPRAVVMQPMPVDPLAGPVAPKATAAAREPRSLQTAGETPVKNDASTKAVAKADAPKPAVEPAKPATAAPKPAAIAQAKPVAAKDQQAKSEPVKPAAPAGIVAQAKPAATVAQAKPAAAVAQAKPAAAVGQAKPAATVGQAKPAAAVAQAKPAAAVAQARNEPVKPVLPTAKVSLPVKAADVKSDATRSVPKVVPPAPVRAADAKPQDGKATAASKDGIPGLRMSANAY